MKKQKYLVGACRTEKPPPHVCSPALPTAAHPLMAEAPPTHPCPPVLPAAALGPSDGPAAAPRASGSARCAVPPATPSPCWVTSWPCWPAPAAQPPAPPCSDQAAQPQGLVWPGAHPHHALPAQLEDGPRRSNAWVHLAMECALLFGAGRGAVQLTSEHTLQRGEWGGRGCAAR